MKPSPLMYRSKRIDLIHPGNRVDRAVEPAQTVPISSSSPLSNGGCTGRDPFDHALGLEVGQGLQGMVPVRAETGLVTHGSDRALGSRIGSIIRVG